MNKTATLAAAWLVDWFSGDPEWLPHPVRLIGSATRGGERLLRRPAHSPSAQVAAGAVLTFTVVATTYLSTGAIIEQAYRFHRRAGVAVEVLLGSTCLATRNLLDEGESVLQALRLGDLPHARRRLARIVGRDTQVLSPEEIHRAVIETLAESACDGILAPIFYLALGGVPLAMAYKAINTLDSMIGHLDERYRYFGKVAARLDDTANYLPARFSGLAITLAAGSECGPGRGGSAWRTWRRDSQKHKSPNAGNPESALAGALQVRLGGNNTYAGELVETPLLGEEFPPPQQGHVEEALRIITRVSVIGVAVSLLLLSLHSRRTRA